MIEPSSINAHMTLIIEVDLSRILKDVKLKKLREEHIVLISFHHVHHNDL